LSDRDQYTSGLDLIGAHLPATPNVTSHTPMTPNAALMREAHTPYSEPKTPNLSGFDTPMTFNNYEMYVMRED
jgi:hypothetical protein